MLRAVLVLAVAATFASPAGAAAQWSAPVSLTGDARFVFRPQVAFAGAGDAVVAYGVGIEGGSVLGLARARPGQDAAFAATQTTTTDPATRVLTYAGSRLLVVSQTQRGLPFELRARFGSLAAGGDGSFAVGWFAQELTEGGSNGPAVVRLAVRSAGGRSFHTARALETFAERAPQGAAVHVALAPDGTGVAGWTGRQDGRF